MEFGFSLKVMSRRPSFSTVGGIPRSGLVDRKQRSNIRAAVPASLTSEPGHKIGEPNVIRPGGGVDHYRMRALVVATVNQQPARAGLPHFPESDFLFAQGPSKRGGHGIGKPLQFAVHRWLWR